jgi:hypothetical protein
MAERSLDIIWHADMRIDTLLRYDDELIGLIRRAGCTALTFGIETGSDRMLGLIKKGITVEQVLAAHRRLRNFDVLIHYQFMIGFPDETVDDIRRTLRLIRELVRSERVFIHGLNMYQPYPGTPLFNRCVELGFKPPQTLDEWYDFDFSFNSKLNFFTGRHRGYLAEACHLSPTVQLGQDSESLAAKLIGRYRMLRLEGFIRGIRLYNLDVRLARILKRLLTFSRALLRRR